MDVEAAEEFDISRLFSTSIVHRFSRALGQLQCKLSRRDRIQLDGLDEAVGLTSALSVS